DPVRTPEPEALAERLPRGAAVVYRAFGAEDAEARGARLMAIARRRGWRPMASTCPSGWPRGRGASRPRIRTGW
ncbi:MAG: hypothetical protein ACHP7A_03885, partial [Caulobacterales bacterium]